MLKRKLLRSVLPMLLSISMVFGSVPETVSAAEYESHTIEQETLLEEEETVDKRTEALENIPESTGGGYFGAEERTTQETDFASTDTIPATDNSEQSTTSENTAEELAEEAAKADENNAANALDTRIILNKERLEKACTGICRYDIDKDLVQAKYDAKNSDPFSTILNKLKSTSAAIFSVEVDGKADSALFGKLTFQWQKADGTAFEEGAVPTAAGDYKLLVSIEAVENVCTEDKITVAFQIAKRQLSITLPDEAVQPGTTVGTWKEHLNYELMQENSNWQGDNETIGEDKRAAYIEAVSVEVYDAHNMETAFPGETKLVEGSDYAVKIKPVLKQEVSSNYAIPEEIVCNLPIADLIATNVKAEQNNPSELIAKVYDGEKFSYAAAIKDKLQICVTAYDALNPDEEKVLEHAAVTEVWFDSTKAELGEGADAEPTQAGTYYLGFRYYPAEVDANVYSKATDCQDFIKVVIERAPLTLVPSFQSDVEPFYTGMSTSDVLRYADYKLLDAANDEFAIDRTTFWGVSYDDVSDSKYDDEKTDTMQSYEPVFAVIRAKKDADGNPVKDLDGRELWTADTGVLDKDFLYRLVFTGKKAVYKKNGNFETGLKGEVDVNGSDADAEARNYTIVTSQEVLFGNYVDVPVVEAKQTAIDVSGILQQGFNTKNLNELYQPAKLVSKVYDGAGLYETRADYKKAVVTAADGTEAAKDYDAAITYQWYRITEIEAVYDETDAENRKQTGWKVSKSSVVNTPVRNGIPTNAGDYMLQINFAKEGYVPCAETIYYRIDKQQLAVGIENIPSAYQGDTVERYLGNVRSQGSYAVYKVPQNQYNDAVWTAENRLTDWHELPFDSDISDYSGDCYRLDWYVEQAQKNADGSTAYGRLDETSVLTETAADTYRLGVTLKSSNVNYENFEIIYHEEITPVPQFETVYHNDYKMVAVSETKGIEVTLALDETKLVTTKVYDGKPFYASQEEGIAAVENALTVTNAATGDMIPKQELPKLSYAVVDTAYADAYGYEQSVGFDEILHGGSYALQIEVQGDETYRYAPFAQVATYTIHKAALDVTPALMEDIPAGTHTTISDGTVYDLSKTEFKGFVETDAEAFQYGTLCDDDNHTKKPGFSAYYSYDADNECYLYGEPSAVIKKAGSAANYKGYIRYNTDYALQLSGALAYPYVRDYDVHYVRTIFRATRRGSSIAQETDFCGKTAAFVQQNTEAAVEITPTSELPYLYLNELRDWDEAVSEEGNYFAFRITTPREFMENKGNYQAYANRFVYKNSIEAAGGFVYDEDAGQFLVLFPIKEKADKSFDILWENGYTETYTIHFANAVLQDDLTRAVAPKSLSFNGVNAKMAVGDEQPLDVKIKKAQLGDVIRIDYKVTQGDDVVSITTGTSKSAAGYATALKPGKAVISAFPVRMVNGVMTPIEGAKAATVSITVSDVAVPAVKKLAAFDTSVRVQYVKPANGYRREIYVLEGKQKPEAFESAIGKIQNGRWQGIFAAEPVYLTEETLADAKTKLVSWKTIGHLLPDKEYTLYVRNVSGIRTLAEGSCVSLSAKGTVKSFKTTKPQIKDLRLRAGLSEEHFTTNTKTVLLSDKTEQLYTDGLVTETVINDAADTTDSLWLSLPLEKIYAKTIVAPKLTYWVSASRDSVDPKLPDKIVSVEEIRDFRNYVYVNGKYYDRTDIATVDKKGKVTFKGVGTAYVHVRDDVTGLSASIRLNICATADSMTAKAAKLAVGRQVYLSSLLTYYEGKTALLGVTYHNYRADGVVPAAVRETTYKPNLVLPVETLKAINREGNFSIEATSDGDYRICALKPNAECSLNVADGTLSASVTIQSAPIESVKNLKITDVIDKGFTISFSYPVDTNLRDVKYRVDITDARGDLVDSVLWKAADYTSHDGKKKTFTRDVKYQNDKLTRLSKYNVSITTLCAAEASTKPVTKAAKTTDFPAAYHALGKTGYGGMPIDVYGKAGGTTQFQAKLKDRKYLTSGNAYTLSAQVTTPAQFRMTDSLTWKSSDTKVAAVKAKAGTYTAQLNALKPGSAEIEVTSKITKKVIARWVVFVKAVGNAETYYGDYEFTYDYPFLMDPYYTAKTEVLTLQNDVYVTPSEVANASYAYWWVKFTAPAKGMYAFDYTAGKLTEVVSSMERQVAVSDIDSPDGIWLTEGESLYFKLRGSFTMHVSDYIKQGKSFTIDDGSVSINSGIKQIVEFRSSEDNVYTFYSKELPGLAGSLTLYDEQMNGYGSGKYRIWTDDKGIQKIDISLKDKEITYFQVPAGNYTIYAEKRTPEKLSDDGATLALTEEVKEKWYIYMAEQEGLYTFKSKDAAAMLTAEYFASLKDLDSTVWSVSNDGSNFTGKMTLKAGQKVFFKISADEAATAVISVTPEIPVRLSEGEEKELPVKTDDRKWVAFTVSEAGRYQFRAVAAESGADYQVKLRYYKNAIEENEFELIDEDVIIVSDNKENKPDVAVGDTIYAEVTTDKEGGDAANVKVSLTQVRATKLKIGEPVSITVKNGNVQWFSYTVPKNTRYVVQSVVTENSGADNTAGDTHKLTAELYAGGLEQRDKTNTLNTIGVYDFAAEMAYSEEKSEAIRVSANDLGLGENGGEIITTAVIVLKEAVEPLPMNDPQIFSLRKGERKWFSFTVSEAGRYQLRAAAAESGADYQVKLRYYNNIINENVFTLVDENEMIVSDNKGYQPDAAVGDTIYVEITTDKEGADAANVKVSLTQVRATELKIGEPVSVTVKNGDVQWFSYTVPKDTRYVVQSIVTENIGADNTAGDTHKLTAELFAGGLGQRYKTNTLDTIGAYDFVREKEFSTEKTESIRVSANDLGFDENGGEITTTAVIVLKEAVEPLAMNDPQEISLRTNERRWFSFTAPETNTYLFRSDVTEGNFSLSYKNSMSSDNWYSMNNVRHALDLEKDQTIYLDLSARRDTAAKLTFSVEFPDKLSGTAEKTVTVTSETPAYFMYVTGSDELARYAVTYTKDAQDAAVSLFYDDTSANPNRNSITEGYAECDIEDRYFFKASTTSETPVTVTVKIVKIEPMKLNVGVTENISVAPKESDVRKNTWCYFTAPEAGRYVIDKTTSDFSTLSFYKKMTGNANLEWQNYYYEKGETIYIGLYTTSENAQTTNVEIKKIEPTPIEPPQTEGAPVSVTDQIPSKGMLNTKGYLYTAPKTGHYTFTNQQTSSVKVKLYMDLSDWIGDTVTGSSPGSLFLKENDTVYIDVMPTQPSADIDFTIEYAGEAQPLSAGENTITFGGQSNHLTAFTAPEAGLYHFDIVYTGEEDSSIGATGSAYLMKESQLIGGTNSSLYSAMSGNAGSIAFANRLIARGETVYLSIPKPASATGAAISVSKAEETVKTETITEDIELERVFEDGDQVYYIFDVPEDGTYKLLAESRVDTGYCYYNIYYNRYGLSDSDALKYAGILMNVGTSSEKTLGSLNKRQRIYLRADKTTQSGDAVSKLALTITKTE